MTEETATETDAPRLRPSTDRRPRAAEPRPSARGQRWRPRPQRPLHRHPPGHLRRRRRALPGRHRRAPDEGPAGAREAAQGPLHRRRPRRKTVDHAPGQPADPAQPPLRTLPDPAAGPRAQGRRAAPGGPRGDRRQHPLQHPAPAACPEPGRNHRPAPPAPAPGPPRHRPDGPHDHARGNRRTRGPLPARRPAGRPARFRRRQPRHHQAPGPPAPPHHGPGRGLHHLQRPPAGPPVRKHRRHPGPNRSPGGSQHRPIRHGTAPGARRRRSAGRTPTTTTASGGGTPSSPDHTDEAEAAK